MIDHSCVIAESAIVIEAALLAREQTLEGRGPVAAIRRPLGLEIIDADLGAGMHLPARLGVERRHIAGCASPLALEDHLAPLGGRAVIRGRGWHGRWDGELVEVEGGELGSDTVVGEALVVPEPGARCDGELGAIVEARIVEHALAVHLVVGDVGVPIGDRAPTGLGVQVYAGEPEGGGQKGGGRLAVGPERLAIDIQLGVELARPPAREHLAHGRLVHAQELYER